MNWTQVPPVEPGWYWFRNRAGDVGVVEVDASLIDRAKKQYGYFMEGETDFALFWGDRPIESPSEAEVVA